MSSRAAGARLAAAFGTTAPEPSGSYIDRGKTRPSSPASYDEDREEALWRTAADLCGLPVGCGVADRTEAGPEQRPRRSAPSAHTRP
jgi:hypothetical protein